MERQASDWVGLQQDECWVWEVEFGEEEVVVVVVQGEEEIFWPLIP